MSITGLSILFSVFFPSMNVHANFHDALKDKPHSDQISSLKQRMEFMVSRKVKVNDKRSVELYLNLKNNQEAYQDIVKMISSGPVNSARESYLIALLEYGDPALLFSVLSHLDAITNKDMRQRVGGYVIRSFSFFYIESIQAQRQSFSNLIFDGASKPTLLDHALIRTSSLGFTAETEKIINAHKEAAEKEISTQFWVCDLLKQKEQWEEAKTCLAKHDWEIFKIQALFIQYLQDHSRIVTNEEFERAAVFNGKHKREFSVLIENELYRMLLTGGQGSLNKAIFNQINVENDHWSLFMAIALDKAYPFLSEENRQLYKSTLQTKHKGNPLVALLFEPDTKNRLSIYFPSHTLLYQILNKK